MSVPQMHVSTPGFVSLIPVSDSRWFVDQDGVFVGTLHQTESGRYWSYNDRRDIRVFDGLCSAIYFLTGSKIVYS